MRCDVVWRGLTGATLQSFLNAAAAETSEYPTNMLVPMQHYLVPLEMEQESNTDMGEESFRARVEGDEGGIQQQG